MAVEEKVVLDASPPLPEYLLLYNTCFFYQILALLLLIQCNLWLVEFLDLQVTVYLFLKFDNLRCKELVSKNSNF